MEESIIEGNRLIGEFDGYVYESESSLNGIKGVLKREDKLTLHANIIGKNFCTEYHSSWDWLMPVVKKWNDLVISKRNGGKAGWTKWQYKTVMLRTEIEPVFNDLVEFFLFVLCRYFKSNKHQ